MASIADQHNIGRVDKSDVSAPDRHQRSHSRSPRKPTPSAAIEIYPQRQCPFFSQLPQEVREMVFRHLFSMTRISLGVRDLPVQGDRVRIKSDPNALALPRTCRRAHDEIGQTWVRHVLFNFEDTVTLLNRLAFVPDVILGQIRHMRVPVRPPREFWHRYIDQWYRPPGTTRRCFITFLHIQQALSLLSGLRLDTLTVMGPRLCEWDEIAAMVCRGHGWKELRFICPDSTAMNYGANARCKEWRRLVQERDGTSSGASMEIYRSTVGPSCFQLSPTTCELRMPELVSAFSNLLRETAPLFVSSPPAARLGMVDGDAPGHDILNTGLRERFDEQDDFTNIQCEMLYVVKRGEGICYEISKPPELFAAENLYSQDLRSDLLWVSWKVLKKLCEDDPKKKQQVVPNGDDDVQRQVIDDQYKSVDEYDWAVEWIS